MFEPTHTPNDLIPEVREPFRRLFERARATGLAPSVGWAGAGRTCAMQNSLDPAATSATGCQSWHVLGRALDLQLTPWSYDAYRALGEWWESIGGFWGGRWTQFGPMGDTGHFHWPVAGMPPGTPPGCPSGQGEAACEAYRQQYLTLAWERPILTTPERSRGLLPAMVIGAAAAIGGVYWWRKKTTASRA